ncbi:MAG: isocitrate lyase/phosphoenolpyruvate mutase family protein [Betaproteobacteria bacterium]|nr:isocitrate lyase/phosphoenolpyruvate mutase family protein [Betaproteobacteria bacterium]MDH3437775.1 isocitrate lyase/phosphoenolpyruvate mutase family protein [Betaproteobacteria bacterium]
MNHTEQRKRLRAVLGGTKCVSPASIYDPLSARVAEAVGYEIGMLAGSVASNTTLAAPDLIVLTLTEFADQVRRIMRASRLSLIVDADHGYGNALNVMRTVEELEHSGVSGMSIEDTALPTRFGQTEGTDELISLDEMVGKLKAAVAARRDPETVILGRTAALKVEGTEGTVKRAQAFAACGVDAIFVIGVESADQVRAVQEAARLPVMVGSAPASIKREDFAAAGARVLLQGHQPVAAAVKALRETYAHLFTGGAPADLKDKIASAKEMGELVNGAVYKQWQSEYLQTRK